MASFKAPFAAVLVYLRDNPGVVSLIVGQVVLMVAHLGLKVSDAQLYEVGSALVPLLLAYFGVATKQSAKAKAVAPPAP